MAFAHLGGVAPAPNEIDNWFAAFEGWITGVGWIVSSGSGTDNLVIESVGEHGDKTMLFIRIFRVGVTNVVRMEVRDDAAGTHETTLAQGLDSGGAQFNYLMSADLDAIMVTWENPADTWMMRYAGLVMPFALYPADETYYSATHYRLMQNGRILRRYDGVWDQALVPWYCNEWIREARVDRDDGSFPLGGLLFGRFDYFAGQLKHISGRIEDPAIVHRDTITTHQSDGTTEWLVLRDQAWNKFALRTGGIYPTGDVMDQGNFAHVSGVANTAAQFFDAIVAFMAGRGWTTTDISGASGRPIDWEFNSAGESGTDDIWIRVSHWGAVPGFSLTVADSALGTPGRHETTAATIAEWQDWSYPSSFYISGDRDCVLLTLQTKGQFIPVYAGLVMPTAPNLSSTYMSSVSIGGISLAEMRLLLGHDGVWNQTILWQRGGDDDHTYDSSPNLFDGATTVLWGVNLRETIGAAGEVIGQMKYFYAGEGDSLGVCDVVRVAGHVYRLFYFVSVTYVGWAMRIQ